MLCQPKQMWMTALAYEPVNTITRGEPVSLVLHASPNVLDTHEFTCNAGEAANGLGLGFVHRPFVQRPAMLAQSDIFIVPR
eukprot:29744-Amphidinium_carterae.1